MESSVEIMDAGVVLKWEDITGKMPEDCKYHIPYAVTEQVQIKEGLIIRHSYSHVLYFMEVYEFRLHHKFRGSFRVSQSSLFLFSVLSGKITFSMPGHPLLRTAGIDTIYATRNEPSEFFFDMAAGDEPQCLCNFTIRPTWLNKDINDYLGLKPFLVSMERESALALYSYMPACKMNKKIKEKLDELFRLVEPTKDDLEIAQLRVIKSIIAEYQQLALIKLSHPVYQIRNYLEDNYASPELDNEKLATMYNITKSTLFRNFKREFGTTPHLFLTGVRMQHAYDMLMKEKKPVHDVYHKVGFKDLHSFSIQYKKHFGTAPIDH